MFIVEVQLAKLSKFKGAPLKKSDNLTNRMRFSIVCTLIDNDIRHHSGQNVVRRVSPQQILTTVMTNIVVDKSADNA